ncbi:ADP-ribosylglycohydrolase family protein [Deinococcus aquatilis]|uniref:ADP-ribosylglycohydrolase family protein n=1 Tax=Deinococcus aquatilis TaxID=519440 RepID=UPI0003752A06|nr:ADP-ribosylglycohydrolase family protein [Deinococcus aquatilis]
MLILVMTGNTPNGGLSRESGSALSRAFLSLEGLSVGDAFGEQFFLIPEAFDAVVASRQPPAGVWSWTDDTQMALSVVAVLEAHGEICQNDLARRFAQHFDPSRGYGPSMQRALRQMQEGAHWQMVVREAFEGQGSYGNGSAMRAGPIGAYFAPDLDRVVEQARLSSLVTHSHPEAVAGAIAVAVAAALCAQGAEGHQNLSPPTFLDLVQRRVPSSEVASKIRRARDLPQSATLAFAVSTLGNGVQLSAQDTVPFALWCASRHLQNVEEALWTAVSGGGDRDTICAMVGSIVHLRAPQTLPTSWLQAREPLPEHFSALPDVNLRLQLAQLQPSIPTYDKGVNDPGASGARPQSGSHRRPLRGQGCLRDLPQVSLKRAEPQDGHRGEGSLALEEHA